MKKKLIEAHNDGAGFLKYVKLLVVSDEVGYKLFESPLDNRSFDLSRAKLYLQFNRTTFIYIS